ncbi:MAG: hypothetical protein HQK79_14725 [Desulfobacterales bacterium]|nr:hypothetical protein [Desulfobacterales bacterium]MBF0397158.1 hypothetical protein [Desulfobacterales bacterium]
MSGKSGKLSDMIRKAISDCEITTTEYDQILNAANEDGIIDAEEKNLLKQLQELISNQTVKRVQG